MKQSWGNSSSLEGYWYVVVGLLQKSFLVRAPAVEVETSLGKFAVFGIVVVKQVSKSLDVAEIVMAERIVLDQKLQRGQVDFPPHLLAGVSFLDVE